MNHPINNKKSGIDVSYSQGQINWPEIKNHIDFAIIRCGYGDNIESQDDAYWKYNADACTRLNIPFGVYIYSYACLLYTSAVNSGKPKPDEEVSWKTNWDLYGINELNHLLLTYTDAVTPVSYTHLDVYKRQDISCRIH